MDWEKVTKPSVARGNAGAKKLLESVDDEWWRKGVRASLPRHARGAETK